MNRTNKKTGFDIESENNPVKQSDGLCPCLKGVGIGLVIGTLAIGLFKLFTYAPVVAAIKAAPLALVIAGGAVAAVVTILAISLLLYCCCCRKKASV